MTADVELEIVTESSDEYLDVLRHSAAHVFAQALQRLYSDAKLTIGPWTDNGFYYDITGVDIDEDDLEAIEAEAEEIIEEDLDIERELVDRDDAFERYEDNQFKQDILETEAADDEEVSFYTQGEFEDLCKGPHVESTGKIGAVELLNISSAYWRGDEENETLTRVYGTAFAEKDLKEYMELRARPKSATTGRSARRWTCSPSSRRPGRAAAVRTQRQGDPQRTLGCCGS